jgi:hypothetical protein
MDPLSVVVLAVHLPSTAWCIPHLGVSCANHNNGRIGAIAHNTNNGSSSRNNNNSSSTCSYSPAAIVYSQATTVGFHPRLSVLQLWKGGTLHPCVPHAQAKQLTMSSSSHGQSTEAPTDMSYTTDWPRQLHHCAGDSHRRRSASGYVHPQ